MIILDKRMPLLNNISKYWLAIVLVCAKRKNEISSIEDIHLLHSSADW